LRNPSLANKTKTISTDSQLAILDAPNNQSLQHSHTFETAAREAMFNFTNYNENFSFAKRTTMSDRRSAPEQVLQQHPAWVGIVPVL
jgi:hypothetical protein